MNDFRRITVCAVDGLNPHLAARALERSMDQCDFADAILLTDTPVPTRARVISCRPLRSRQDYSEFVIRQMAEHIQTPYVLIVQWDGYVLDASQWDPAFLSWDYIGAPWPTPEGQAVGNGGFCLRSRRLLDAMADPVFHQGQIEFEDRVICETYRPLLEKRYGVRFSPVAVAHRFSHEHYLPDSKTFGFHGLFNLWRHSSPAQVLALVQEFSAPTFSSKTFLHFLIDYIERGQFHFAQRLLRLVQDRLGEQEALECLRRAFADPVAAATFVATCRQLLAVRVPAATRRQDAPTPGQRCG